MRELRVVGAEEPARVLGALRDALSGEGAAVLPRAAGAQASPGGDASEEVDTGTSLGPVPRTVALVIETSGSTGVPKRVMLSTDALLASAAASTSALGGGGQWLLALPAHYVAGAQVLVRSIAAQTEPVLHPAGHFDPAEFARSARALSEERRFTSLVPVQLARLVDAAEGDAEVLAAMRRFDGILVGGQAVRPELVARARGLGFGIRLTYGSSETCGGCVYDGRPIGNTRVRLVDGLVELGGSVLAEGYLADPERTDAAFRDDHGERWYRTGDLGVLDGETLTVLGRADNVIVSGGEKVSLDAVERRVRSLDGLGDAVVVAADDPEWGQAPVVVAEGSVRGLPGIAELRAVVAGALGRAAAPRSIVIVERLPVLASGKPDRIAITRIAAEESGPGIRA
ncbi:AMP-binding protein [Compostimonas suwonensis]|uniref:O-succinylbenzoic acid--CoA ligase n=1 Tax=Compostimonas suwonensis TaxID=1048394 RepID=A0A2M9C3I1_9MICO|nr:AMP-binding protein [Compostimonas suwonensis]PJJ65017.1 O-succinylbenzoic acid--CoA ligase [Compostimonas suwonensis]